ncbi:MAG: hypothetical protein K1W06_07325 [Lachnospiraceae bacterium]
MTKEKNYKINEEEVIKAFLIFRNFSLDEQAFAVAFVNGMKFQRKLDNTDNVLVSENSRS